MVEAPNGATCGKPIVRSADYMRVDGVTGKNQTSDHDVVRGEAFGRKQSFSISARPRRVVIRDEGAQ